MLLKASLAILLTAGVCTSLGCDPDDDMGGPSFGAPCARDLDCGSRCAHGEHYPGGICTKACLSDADCYPGTRCVVDEGGICALSCGGGSDECLRFGPDYRCTVVGQKGGTGNILVCRKP